MENFETHIRQAVAHAAKEIEKQVDEEIERLQNPDELEKLKEERMKKLKLLAAQKTEWKKAGHGEYEEIPDEKTFFEVSKKSARVVAHFSREATERCKIVDKHLKILAQNHLETRFVKLNAEKSPFLTDRLKIKVLPTILILKDATVVDRVVGFGDLGGVDDFRTEMLEWRLARCDGVFYQGDKDQPPEFKQKKRQVMRTIRGKDDFDSDESDDE
ncbi:Thioredoxin domain-containing protein 9 [Orchesella cincta]|uniref:Thioredoxin domain-containing protein 9 n=1 Tax=Orchesella cincta TaxID=48709 RepID=A0A1D2NCI2_ORCCI|nr:Thioredoxin domain-containing protein 9 [Orchesella cincta]